MAHKGHPVCQYTSKAACERARREELGPCIAMLSEDRQCNHLATDKVDGRGYCGQHISSVYLAADNAARLAVKRAAVDARIDRYQQFVAEHPSVWDAMHDPLLAPVFKDDDVSWLGSSAVGVHMPTGTFVVEQDGTLISWEGPYE